MKPSSVLVIFPVCNEAENLDPMLDTLMDVVQRERYDLVAIDDASTDESQTILNRRGVQTITLFKNLGYGAALQTGYKYAVSKGYRYLLQMDGDGQHDPRFLPILCRKLQNHDFVIGSRFLDHDLAPPFRPKRELYTATASRRMGIRGFRLLLYLLSGVWMSDPTSGYVGISQKCLRFLRTDIYPYDFPDADLLLTLMRNKFKLCEVPVYMYHNDKTGRLHRGFAPGWYVCKMTLALFIARIRKPEGSNSL